MSELSLPPVAKSFYTFCKKCEADRYHVVLAHKTARSASIQCEICKSKKSYSLPKPGAAKKTTARTTGTGTSRRSHAGDYEVRMQNTQNKTATPYSIKGKFSENEKINHAKFGIGFVIRTFDDKVEVIFSDEVKSLMQNRI